MCLDLVRLDEVGSISLGLLTSALVSSFLGRDELWTLFSAIQTNYSRRYEGKYQRKISLLKLHSCPGITIILKWRIEESGMLLLSAIQGDQTEMSRQVATKSLSIIFRSTQTRWYTKDTNIYASTSTAFATDQNNKTIHYPQTMVVIVPCTVAKDSVMMKPTAFLIKRSKSHFST